MSLAQLGSLGVPVKEILLNLPFEKLIQRCIVSGEFNDFCNSDNFWKDYLYKYTRITKPIRPLTYKQTTRLLFHFLNRLWENPTLKFISTHALEQIIFFMDDVYQTYDEYLNFFNNIVARFDENPVYMMAYQTFAELFTEINSNYTVQELFEDYYNSKYGITYNKQSQYFIPVVLKTLNQRITYIQRDAAGINNRLVTLNFNPDDAIHLIVIEMSTSNDMTNELEEMKDFIIFSIDNFA